MNGRTTILTKAWKTEYAKLTAERKTLNQGYLALKEEMKEDEQIRTSVYSVLPHEQRKRLPPPQGTGYGTVTERRRNNRCLSRRPVLTFHLPNKQKFVNKKYVLYDIE